MIITVIGELCQDIFVYGESNRLSPEAPVPIFLPLYHEQNNGMAGNVVENLKSLDSNLEINFYYQKEKITKTRYVDAKSNHMFLRIDEGEKSINLFELNEEIISKIKNSDMVIVSDYNKGFLNDEILKNITNISKFSVIDTKGNINSTTLSYFDFIKVNHYEFKKLKNVNDDLIKKIIVTKGADGAKYMDTDFPSPDPKETIDVSGAGDTFTASFALNYIKTKNINDSIVYANKMASIVVSKRGVSTPY